MAWAVSSLDGHGIHTRSLTPALVINEKLLEMAGFPSLFSKFLETHPFDFSFPLSTS